MASKHSSSVPRNVSRKSRSHCSLGGRQGPLPTTRSRAALITRLSRASSSSCVGVCRTIRRRATSGGLCVEPRRRRIVRETAGADERDAHVLVGQELADRFAERAHPPKRRPRIGGAIHEDRQHVVAGERTGELEQRNGDAVIDLHLMRDRHVEIARLQVANAGQRQLARNPQRRRFPGANPWFPRPRCRCRTPASARRRSR